MAVGLSVVVLFAPASPSGLELIGLDKIIHAVLFAALAASTRARFRRGLGWVLAYALASEVLQSLLPIHRDGNPLDAVADGVGALAGWLVTGWVGRPGVAGPGGDTNPA